MSGRTVGAFVAGLILGVVGGRVSTPTNETADTVAADVQVPDSIAPAVETQVPVTPVPTRSSPSATTPRVAPTMPAAVRDSLERERDRLIARFDFAEDRIRGGGWYRHKDQRLDARRYDTFLRAPFTHTGRIYLESNYFGSGWIFHRRVLARVGETVLETESTDPSDQERETGSRGVFETVSFNRASDRGLLQAIARSATGTTIRVRLIGQSTDEYVLEQRDHDALRESVALAALLRRLGPPASTAKDTVRFVGDSRFRVYFPATCLEARSVPDSNARVFVGENAAKNAGFTRSPISSC